MVSPCRQGLRFCCCDLILVARKLLPSALQQVPAVGNGCVERGRRCRSQVVSRSRKNKNNFFEKNPSLSVSVPLAATDEKISVTNVFKISEKNRSAIAGFAGAKRAEESHGAQSKMHNA